LALRSILAKVFWFAATTY